MIGLNKSNINFIGFKKSLHGNKDSHNKLMSNYVGQMQALMKGRSLKEVISEFNNDEIISESKLFLKTHIEKSENAAMKIENKDIRNILLDLNRYLIERSN